ncbi:GTP-binding protein [Candidatus Thorarchaeota archaeon]|nr:MAG: GTP-binding protein [Candidatus Thorarchaeota archaeon]
MFQVPGSNLDRRECYLGNTTPDMFCFPRHCDDHLESTGMTQYVKVALMGSGYAGKSTLIKLLTDSTSKLECNYRPTVGMDCGTITLDEDTKISLVEMGGQSHFEFMWPDMLQGSRMVVVVTESTPKAVLKTRQLLEKHRHRLDGAQVIAIANKQDLPGSMKPASVQDLLGIPTYGMVAIDPKQRLKGYKLIVDGLRDMVQVAA